MKSLLEWTKKHIVISLILALIMILIPVLLIHILYSIEAPSKFFIAKWSAGELLQFYGSVLSFVGTVILGGLALWQNQQLAIRNQEFNELINKQQKQLNLPKFDITSIMGSNGSFTNWYITLKNVSENIVNKLDVSLFKVYDENETLIESKDECSIQNSSLQAGEETRIEFNNSRLIGNYLKVKFIINYEDKYNEKHSCEVRTEIINQKCTKKFEFIYIK